MEKMWDLLDIFEARDLENQEVDPQVLVPSRVLGGQLSQLVPATTTDVAHTHTYSMHLHTMNVSIYFSTAVFTLYTFAFIYSGTESYCMIVSNVEE